MKILLILASLIPIKKYRRFIKQYIKYEEFRSKVYIEREYAKKNDKSFSEYKVKANSVLIVEPNCYHGEILPGFVKYFQDLGFNIDLLLRHQNSVDDIFCRFNKKPHAFYGTSEHLKKLLSSKKIQEYEYVFFSSSAFWEEYKNFDSYLNYLGFEPASKRGIILVEHNIVPYMSKYNEERYLTDGRLYTLSGFEGTPMLNPHYFGDQIKITPKSKGKTVFIVVGGVDKNCKNHDLLIDSVKELSNVRKDFEVVVVGAGNIDIPDDIDEYIKKKGRLDFEKMYEEMERADFFLPLLDIKSENHQKYLSGTTTGSRQLILGFAKPCVINEKFGKAYDFDENNSIFYNGNELFPAMLRAISMGKEEYAKKQDCLRKLSDKIYSQSINNLKRLTTSINNQGDSKDKKNFVMFCKTYRKDIERFKVLVDSFNKYNLEDIPLYVSIPEQDWELFKDFSSENIKIIKDEDIPVNYFEEDKPCGFSKGYMNQQITKLGFWKLNKCNHYLCVDADVQFIRPFYVSDFMYDKNTPFADINHFRYNIADVKMSAEHYYIHINRIKKIRKAYGFTYQPNERYLLSNIGFPILSTQILKSMEQEFLIPNHYEYKDLLKIAPVEFHWYSQWLLEKPGDMLIKTTHPFILFFRNKKEYDEYRINTWDIKEIKKYYVGIALNSNWSSDIKFKKANKFILKLLKVLKKWA